jgi:cysteine desulfurase/selenocysteine lyase
MDVNKIRKEFPILSINIDGKNLYYFDNAATTQKPKSVIDTINEIYAYQNSNIHRGAHYLSNLLTNKFEEARDKVKEFINADLREEIIFTYGTTSSINLLSYSFGEEFVKEGDEIITTQLEHHSNIVPWQILCERKNAKLKYIPLHENGHLDIEKLDSLITSDTKLVTIAHVANSTGTINDIKRVIQIAHSHNVPVLIDAAQSIQHLKVDVKELDCDFLVFSGHKIYGPTGIGVLYGKKEWLDKLPPFMGGGEMIDNVTMEKTTYNRLPWKFEAGTPNYVGAIGLGVAIDFINNIGIEEIAEYEKSLYEYALNKAKENSNLRIIGPEDNKISVLSFVHNSIPAGDLGFFLDKWGIAIRTGNHCAQPAMEFFGISGTARLSVAMYNTKEEVDYFFEKLKEAEGFFGV